MTLLAILKIACYSLMILILIFGAPIAYIEVQEQRSFRERVRERLEDRRSKKCDCDDCKCCPACPKGKTGALEP